MRAMGSAAACAAEGVELAKVPATHDADAEERGPAELLSEHRAELDGVQIGEPVEVTAAQRAGDDAEADAEERGVAGLLRGKHGGEEEGAGVAVSAAESSAHRKHRDRTVDVWRGITMVLMALDHVNISMLIIRLPPDQRFAFGETWLRQHEPIVAPHVTFLSALSFIIRSIVSFPVMPAFAFLMGVGMQLLVHSRQRQNWSAFAIWRFFLLRGATLALPVNALVGVLFFDFDDWTFASTILGCLGINMVITASVITCARGFEGGARMNLDAILSLLLGPVCLVSTQWFVSAAPPDFQSTILSSIFVVPGSVGRFQNSDVALPFLGVTLLGAAFGRWHTLGIARQSASPRARWLVPLVLSVVLLLSFVFLRLSDAWGNTYRYGQLVQAGVPGWIAFFSLTKYPPSLAYFAYSLAFILGLYSIIVMYDAFSERGIQEEGRVVPVLLVFSRSALAFYVLHFYVIMIIAGISFALFPLAPAAATSVSPLSFCFALILHLLHQKREGREGESAPFQFVARCVPSERTCEAYT